VRTIRLGGIGEEKKRSTDRRKGQKTEDKERGKPAIESKLYKKKILSRESRSP